MFFSWLILVISDYGRRQNPSNGYYSMGRNTFNVSMKLFEENRRRLVERLRFLFSRILFSWDNYSKVFWRLKVKDGNGVVLLMSATHPKGYSHGDSSNAHPVFIQEGYFHWYFIGKPSKIKYISHIAFKVFWCTGARLLWIYWHQNRKEFSVQET